MKMIVVLAVALLSACGKSGSSTVSGANEKPLVVTAEVLTSAYKANEVAADEKYKGKKLAVVGILDSIDKDAFDNMILHLKAGPQSLLGVMATMQDSEKSKVAQLVRGQGAGVVCTGNGMVLGTPMLGDCTVLIEGAKPGTAPAAATTKKK